MTEPTVSPRTYALTFGSLLCLTLLTTLLAFLDLGRMNVVFEIGIAIIKASLIFAIFMHALHEFRLVWVIVGAGIGWLLLLIFLSLYDYATRAWI